MLTFKRFFVLSLFVTLLILAACSGRTATKPAETEVVGNPAAKIEFQAEEAAPSESEAALTLDRDEPDEAITLEYGGGDAAVESTARPLPTASASLAAGETSPAFAPQQTPPLRAGEVDDNQQWDDYLLYRREYRGPRVHDLDISERYIIEVTDGQGLPVLGASVRVSLPGRAQEIYTAQTMANGQVLFHPLALDWPLDQIDQFEVTVEKDGAAQQFTLTRFEAQDLTFTERWSALLDLPPAQDEALNLDVLFLVDATGSMADEIAKIQSTIFDVSARIDALPTRPDVRYGLVTYRDRGDSFVTRPYEFTPDVRDFSANLNTVAADGGGDYPESLNEGLHDALHRVEWRAGHTVKLIFLIADAPPHLDYPQDYNYAVEMQTAAQRGIKIFPIASSGLDDQGEFIFRQLAQYTQGRFLFLTYAGPTNSGAPGDVTTHHVDDYSVDNLDTLLVRLVEAELAHQNRHMVQAQ